MSDGATTGIDPRFDPRYQRGYAVQSTTDGAADAAAPPVPTVARVPEPPEHERDAQSVTARATSSTTEPPHEGAAEAFSGWIADVEPAARRSDVAFAAAWAVSAAALVIGAALYWTGISNDGLYGPSTAADQWLQTVAWLLSPSLVQAGLLGLVGMLVWTGVRHARRGDANGIADAADTAAAAVEARR